jgi:hypothetical protein
MFLLKISNKYVTIKLQEITDKTKLPEVRDGFLFTGRCAEHMPCDSPPAFGRSALVRVQERPLSGSAGAAHRRRMGKVPILTLRLFSGVEILSDCAMLESSGSCF